MAVNENKKRQLKALDVKKKWAASLKDYPNVTGVGVGYKIKKGKRTKTISIRVYVSKKVAEEKLKAKEILPKRLQNIPVDVIEARFRVHGDGSTIIEHRQRQDPMTGGISVGNVTLGGSGTLAASVFDNSTAEDMILSNWHVLCGRFECATGEVIIQPGTGGGDTGSANDIVGELTRAVLSNEVDAAVARVTGHRFFLKEVLGYGTVEAINQPLLGMTVRKSGRTTGLTTATITDVSADITVSGYPDGDHDFHNQLVIEGTNASLPGDSGSLWLDESNMAVGLNFAGDGSGSMANANPISAVVAALNINFGVGITMQDFIVVTNNLLL